MSKTQKSYKKTTKGKHTGLGKYVVKMRRTHSLFDKVKRGILEDESLDFERKLVLIYLLEMARQKSETSIVFTKIKQEIDNFMGGNYEKGYSDVAN